MTKLLQNKYPKDCQSLGLAKLAASVASALLLLTTGNTRGESSVDVDMNTNTGSAGNVNWSASLVDGPTIKWTWSSNEVNDDVPKDDGFSGFGNAVQAGSNSIFGLLMLMKLLIREECLLLP